MNRQKDKRTSGEINLSAVEAAIEHGGALFGEGTSENLDATFDHIVALLDDSATLFMRQSFNTSVFLAITAIEETAKASVGVYRKDHPGKRSKRSDPLRDHEKKHRIAVLPTVIMGERLTNALGEDTCARLQAEAETDGFTRIREAALYCARINGQFVTPRMAVSPARAWELLLLAIETLDDNLIGYTNNSIAKSGHIDRQFTEIAASKPDG